MKAEWQRYRLRFKETAITSRQSMEWKDTYLLTLTDDDGRRGVGECGLFKGLSCDDRPDYEEMLDRVCRMLEECTPVDRLGLTDWPSILVGVEMAVANLEHGDYIYFPSAWSRGESVIEINGLVWMGAYEQMLRRLDAKIEAGFRCIKIKVGAIDFSRELELVRHVRSHYGSDRLMLRLDANGGFKPDNVMSRLDALAPYDIHSIEQPVMAGQWDLMARVVGSSPIAIALDEELIGVNRTADKIKLLDTVRPHYIILKPTLHGGFSGSDEWIKLASERGIGWWATSALESNIGLNAIAQWTSLHDLTMAQGLGTGALYTNNFPSPIVQQHDYIRFSETVE